MDILAAREPTGLGPVGSPDLLPPDYLRFGRAGVLGFGSHFREAGSFLELVGFGRGRGGRKLMSNSFIGRSARLICRLHP
jgi:hypothetical protein